MSKATVTQTSFAGGVVSGDYHGRIDAERYRTSLADLQNYVITRRGAVTRRPGTYFMNEAKNSARRFRLFPFVFNTSDCYVLEVGHLYIRFYRNNGLILSGASAYEVVTPFDESDLAALQMSQSGDAIYFSHQDYAPRRLTRTDHAVWTMVVHDVVDGPYLRINSTSTTLTPAATSGSNVLVTASAALFASTDVGRWMRLHHVVGAATVIGWAKIVSFTSATQVRVSISSAFGAITATASWRLGIWSSTTGFPKTSTIHEDRLTWGAPLAEPFRLDASNSGDYLTMTPTRADGTTTDALSISAALAAGGVDHIEWLRSHEKGILAGTAAAPFLIAPNSQNSAITPTDIAARPSGKIGSAAVTPAEAGRAILYVDRSGTRVYELTYFLDADGFQPEDLSALSDDLTEAGIAEICYQQQPHGILWVATTDGDLLGLTYYRGVDSFFAAWHRHRLGGTANAGGDPPVVETMCVIPSADRTYDELWLGVKRFRAGAVKRDIEYMGKFRQVGTAERPGDAKHEAFYVDCGLTREVEFAISAATKASPVVVTTLVAHGLVAGNTVYIAKIRGMTELNDRPWKVRAAPTTTTLSLEDEDGVAVDGTGFGVYASGGVISKRVSSVSGLSHLNGQVVDVFGDGSAQTATVAAGAITLQSDAAYIAAGLSIAAHGELLRAEPGGDDGPALGKKRRIHRMQLLVRDAMGVSVGIAEQDPTHLEMRDESINDAGQAAAPYTGIIDHETGFDESRDDGVYWQQTQPYPMTLLAVALELEVYDRS